MAKIAVELDYALARRKEDGTPGETTPRVIAKGDGWSVADVVCTCGPADHPYEERHTRDTIAIVQAGGFEYRSAAGRGLMTAGSLMLGSHGQSFECAHRHSEGDRCVSFWYAPDDFERLAADAGAHGIESSVPRGIWGEPARVQEGVALRRVTTEERRKGRRYGFNAESVLIVFFVSSFPLWWRV